MEFDLRIGSWRYRILAVRFNSRFEIGLEDVNLRTYRLI